MPKMRKDVIELAMESGDPEMAEAAFREIDSRLQVLQDARARADLMMRKAVLYEILGRMDDARKQLRTALAEAPSDPGARFQFDFIEGSILHQEHNFSEAFAQLTAVLSNHAEQLACPDNRYVYENIQRQRAFELFALGELERTIPLFKEILTFDSTEPDRSMACAYLGNCYARVKNYEAAKEYLLKGIERGDLRDWEGQAHYDLAVTYASMRLLSDAKREFELCAERAALYKLSLARIYKWLSRVCRGLGQTAESEHYARLARPS